MSIEIPLICLFFLKRLFIQLQVFDPKFSWNFIAKSVSGV